MEAVLSIFPGVGLLDRQFRAAGFAVCEAPDLITGGDIREFHFVPGVVSGVIGGPPCQGFSDANQQRMNPDHPSVQMSREMLRQAIRVILEADPEWFLLENVPNVPDVRIPGYTVQRIPITDWECGGTQYRSRHVQFGSKRGHVIRPERVNDRARTRKKGRKPEAVTTKTRASLDFPDICRQQGLTEPLKLPGWTRTAKFRAVGNGVPVKIGMALAEAVKRRSPPQPEIDCECGCGRSVSLRASTATDACRKRKQMAKEFTRPFVTIDGFTAGVNRRLKCD